MEDTTSDNVLEATSHELHNNQVVHRHLNGLYIITAGNIIQQQLDSLSNGDDNKEDGIQIKSIKYHIQASKDSQSARGKMRTKKKRKKQKHQSIQQTNSTTAVEGVDGAKECSSKTEVANHDGYVTPKDTLCTVTLSNGQEIQLKCCVEGTVIEINNRLVDGSINSDNADTREGSTTQGDISLLIEEPLLDGYLAVIMPSRGVFPPR